MKKKFLMLLAALAVSLGVVAASATPALAIQSPAGYVTVWEGCGSADVGYCGAAAPFAVAGKHGVCQNFPSYINDRNSAVSNNTGYRARFYKDGNCGVPYYDIYGGTETGALTSGQGKNTWSSVRFD